MKKVVGVIVLVVVLVVAMGLNIFNYFHRTSGKLEIAGKNFSVLIAERGPMQFKGLSNRVSLGSLAGMYFNFKDRGIHRMVMRDMKFPLDMVWVDGTKVTDIATDLQPEPGRAEHDLTIYSNTVPGTAVIEFPAGFVKENGIRVGDEAVLK